MASVPPFGQKKKSIWAPWAQEVPGVLGDVGDLIGQVGRGSAEWLGRGLQTANALIGPGSHGDLSFLNNDPAFIDPRIAGQKSALDRADSPTPVKVEADAKAMREQATSATTGQTQAGSKGLTSRPGPPQPSQDHATTAGLTTPSRGAFLERPTQDRFAPGKDEESYIRVKFPGSDEWMEQAPREPDDSRGRSEMDWSKVANPMAFSDYRNRGKRKLMDMQAEDPFVIEREKSRIEDDKANRDAARKVGIYGRQKDIDITNEDNRRTRYQAVYEAKAEELDALMESQKYKKATEQEQERAKAIIEDRYAAQIAAMDKANSKKTERIEAD